jgi:CRISPR-associated endonuclease Csn1
MKTVLGLDLGVASIGWAIVTEVQEKSDLIATGVRIIPIDTETVSNFSKGNTTSKNQERRVKRSIRRNNHRYKLRKHYLTAFLKEKDLWPLPVELFKLSALELYGLRHKAIRERIGLPELARIWFHLNQKRGYIDSRKGLNEEEGTQYVEQIKSRSTNLYKDFETVGSYFYHKLVENPLYRIKSGHDKENIFLVDDYKIEFDLIWKKQKGFYPDLLTDQNFEQIRNKIIYYKRRLKSQKLLIGNCRFEKGHKCMPVSSPIAEEVRLSQDINKLRITSKYGEVFELTSEQKSDLFNFLLGNEKISEKDLLKRYQFPTTRGEYKINYEKGIKGYVFRSKMMQLFSLCNTDFTPFSDFDSTTPEFTNHPFYKLWHLLYATEEIDDLKRVLNAKYSSNSELITGLLKLPIKNDFASLSSRAGRKLLPHLRKGLMYDAACKEAGYNHSNSLTKEENETRELIPVDQLPQIKPNQLKNPTVEKILNQLINLLKGLNKDGYAFDEIRIELARDLKKNIKERKKLTELNQDNEKNNKRIYEVLKELLGAPSRKDIEKYKLWEEFEGCSPYEPNKRIELRDLFNKALYEIEHIIPRSRYFDDSFQNKTIARTFINKEKDNQTALDYMTGKGEDIRHQYTECVKHNKKLSYSKRRNFLMKGTEIPEDFINRQLNETRYITSETLKLLKSVCRNVVSTSGSVTDYLRHNWGYDNVLMDLNFDRVPEEEREIKEIDGQKRKIIKNWSKRLDHRHHALDAIIIATTKQSYIQQLNSLNTFFDRPQNLKPIAIKTKVPFKYDSVRNHVQNILISFKSGKKVATKKTVVLDKWGKKPGNFGQIMLVPRGSLHDESIYGSNLKQRIIDIKNLENVSQCAVLWQKGAIMQHIERYNNDLKTALKNLSKDPVKYGSDTLLSRVTVFENEHVKKYDLQYTTTNKFDLKAATSIVNKNVRDVVIQRLGEFGNDPAKAFKNLIENPLYFNKERGIIIKSVRCYTGGTNYPALHQTIEEYSKINGVKNSLVKINPVDFVKSGNNHHIAIYEDEKGKRIEECVTFFEAFERKQNGLDIINYQHPEGHKFVMSLQQNEMFVFGLQKDEIETAIREENFPLISNHLYRVQKIQPKDYWFRHHLETKLDDTATAKSFKKFLRINTPNNLTGIKVRVTNTGKISIIND